MTDRSPDHGRFGVYLPSGRVGLGDRVFGKDVANFELFQALVRHGGFEQVDFLGQNPIDPVVLRKGLSVGQDYPTRISARTILDLDAGSDAGVVLRGTPRIEDLAWQRRLTSGDDGYSLVGLIHTIAPPALREEIATASIAPIHPWDALICTSPSVQTAMNTMFDDWEAYLAERLGGTRNPRPMLPLIPLGVDGDAIRKRAEKGAAAALRQRLGMAADDLLVIWVGRLSYFEKAFPQPMIRAVAEAGQRAGRRVHFAMAGWFPNPDTEEKMYRQAAAEYAPDLPFHIIDGNDRDAISAVWSAADIFLSLVDNIQETFGITPLEAMAAGLPVVASDWDGYRYTIQDGVQGFLVPTLIGPAGALPDEFGAGHTFRQRSYQQYVGILAQHTAVDVEAAVQALVRLIESPDLRRRMGQAGRERIRTVFDWRVVAPLYRDLATELTAIRAAFGREAFKGHRHPVRGEPLSDFAHFATHVLSDDRMLTLRPGAGRADLDRASRLQLDAFAGRWRATPEECARAVDLLAAQGATSVEGVLETVVPRRRHLLRLGLVWMVKLGLLTWR